MTTRDLISHMIELLDHQATILAKDNGSSRDRTLDQYRYVSGEVSGLRRAALIIENELKKMLDEDD